MLMWLLANKEWLFSGIGVAILAGIYSLFNMLKTDTLIKEKVSFIDKLKLQLNRLASNTIYRNALVRVSCPIFLKLEIDNRFFIIRVHADVRKHTFLPIGGVIKHDNPSILNEIQFLPDNAISGSAVDLNHDLRGVFPLKYLERFQKWLATNTERELNSETLKREMLEELGSIGIITVQDCISQLRFRTVREITQPIVRVYGRRYQFQFRHIVILEISPSLSTQIEFLTRALLEQSKKNPNIKLVTPTEIKRESTFDGEPIAPITALIFGSTFNLGEPYEI